MRKSVARAEVLDAEVRRCKEMVASKEPDDWGVATSRELRAAIFAEVVALVSMSPPKKR